MTTVSMAMYFDFIYFFFWLSSSLLRLWCIVLLLLIRSWPGFCTLNLSEKRKYKEEYTAAKAKWKRYAILLCIGMFENSCYFHILTLRSSIKIYFMQEFMWSMKSTNEERKKAVEENEQKKKHGSEE